MHNHNNDNITNLSLAKTHLVYNLKVLEDEMHDTTEQSIITEAAMPVLCRITSHAEQSKQIFKVHLENPPKSSNKQTGGE